MNPIAPFTWPENPSIKRQRTVKVGFWENGEAFFDSPRGRLSESDARAISGAYIEYQARLAEAEAAGRGN